MNIVVLTGRICKDVVINSNVTGDRKWLINSIAVSKPSDKEGTNNAFFFNIIMFNQTAENFNKFVNKGDKVLVVGMVEANTYGEGDNRKTTYQINVNKFEIIAKNGNSNDYGNASDIADIF